MPGTSHQTGKVFMQEQAAAIQYLQYHHFMVVAEEWSPGKELNR